MWKKIKKGVGKRGISLNQMDKICVWNVRGLNSPRKQKVVREFLTQHSVGLVGLMETKENATGMGSLYQTMFQN